MEEEIKSPRKNHIYTFVDLPRNHKVVRYKWVFKKEITSSVKGKKFKATRVAKFFTQVNMLDYNEIFSLMVKHCSLRILMYIVKWFNLVLD